jgi:hypothetical protein
MLNVWPKNLLIELLLVLSIVLNFVKYSKLIIGVANKINKIIHFLISFSLKNKIYDISKINIPTKDPLDCMLYIKINNKYKTKKYKNFILFFSLINSKNNKINSNVSILLTPVTLGKA